MKKINLVEMLQGCSKRNGTTFRQSNPDGQTTVKRQSMVMSQSGCSAVDVPMTSYGAPDEHPMSIRSASDERRWNSRGWKYVAMIFAVLVLSMANVGMAWGTEFTFSGVYNGTGNGSWNTTTSTTPIVTVDKSISNSSVQIYCVSGSSVSYPSLNNKDSYIKFSVPNGYRITNVNVTWRSNTNAQKIIALFGESLSAISSYVVTATNGGYVISDVIANSGMTNCNDGYNFAISSSHNAKEVMLVRGIAYDNSTYSTANTKYGTFPALLGNSPSGVYTHVEGSGSAAYIGKVVLTVEPTTTTKYTLSYDANGGTGTMPSHEFAAGTTVYAAQNAGFTAPSGKIFKCWNTKANGSGTSYSEWASFSLSANTTLYAQWTTASTSTTYCISLYNLNVSNQMKYFTYSGSSDMQILDLEVPDYQTGKNNFWVGKGGAWKSGNLGNSKASSANERLQDLCLKGNRGQKLGTGSQGVLARFFIYDNSTYDNLYIEFTPKQYSLIWGPDGSSWSPVKLYPSGYENEWTSEVVTLTSDQISSYKYYVGTLKADNGVAFWYKSKTLTVGSMGTYNKRTDTWGGNVNTLSAGAKGFFRMWQNATGYDNWRCHFVPVYTLSYNANGGEGAPASAYTATEGDAAARTLKVSMTEPTRNGYSFEGWATSSANASAGTVAYAPGASITLSADQELWAVWSCIVPDAPTADKISVSDQCQGTGVTFTANTTGIPSYVTWYWQDAADGTSTSNPATSDFTTATTPGTYTKYLRAKNTVCGTWSASGSTPSKSAKVKTAATVSWSAHPTAATYGDGGKTFSVTTNYAGGLEWTLESNTCGAALTGSGTNRTLSYTSVGSVVVKATVTGAGDYCSSAIVSETVTVTAAACTDPVDDLEYTTPTSTGTTLSWDEPGYREPGYKVALTVSGGDPSDSWEDWTSNVYEATGLTPNTTYTFHIKAYGVGKACLSEESTINFKTAATPTYTVTYEYNGATSGATPASATGSSVSLPNPTKTGCTLQGWYTSSGALAGSATATYNPTSDITLYALWRESCAGGGGNKTLVDINFKGASWSGKTFSQGNTTNEDLINGVYFYANNSNASKQFSLADNTTKGLTFPNNNMSSGNYYFCIPITGINSSDKQITVTLKHGYSSAKATYRYVYIDGRTSFEDGNTGGSSGTGVTDAANADTEISFTKSSLGNTSGHLIIGRGGSDFTQIYGVTVTTPNNATCYYVTYNGNGATGGFMTDETAHGSGDNVAILANTYTREGYTFTGWKTEPSSGTSYAPEGTITGISSNITLYAQWSAGTLYSVTYNGNGATSGSVPVDASSPYASGSNVTVLGNTGSLALANYTFDGWATANDGTGTSYTAGGTISSIAADVELFAKWKQTVTLNTGSQGSEEEKTPYIYLNGAALNGFSAHSAAGYTLNGYYTAPTGGTKVLNADGSFAAAAVTNYITGGKWSRTDATTLYAQWRAAAGSTCYEWDATETKPQTGTNVNFGGLYLTAPNKTKVSFYSGQAADSCYDISAKAKTLYGNLNGLEISSVKFAVSSSSSDFRTIFIAFCSSTTFSTSNIIEVDGYQGTVYTVNKNDAAKSEFTVSAPAGTKSFAIGRNMDGITYSESFTPGQNRYLYYLQVCSAGGGTHTITYANGGGTGTMTSDADIADDGTKTLKTNTFTAPTNYSFAGWVADVNVTIGGSTVTAGTLIANGATITNITTDIALTAKWSQSVTLNANTSNHGSGDNGSATAYYNAAALSSITHTTAASGYKLSGYYTADTEGTKVLNSDGTFAGTAVTGYITDGKWTQNTTATPTLYAQYESAGALTWNLVVNSDTTALSTSSKTSAFTEISNANMTDAALTGLTYTKSKKSSLTGKISTPASEDASKYVSVSFQVAAGYKFTPSSIKVKVQPISADQYVKLELKDNAGTPNSITYTTASKQAKGSISTVEMTNGSSVEFTGTVTLKIFCYGKAYDTDGYRLGTPITIEGEVEEACATMPSYTSMSYTTTTFAPNADASGSPITIVGGTNIDTYQWKYNTVNDRTSGTPCGTNNASLTPLTNEGAAADVTRYYWCEMTNTECRITIKSPAVAITVAAAKSDATVVWTDPGSTPNYGGGGYTIKATVNEPEWDGNAADLVITAPAGINIYNVTSGTTSSQKWVQVNFDVQTSFDRTTYASNIPFTVSAAATASYNAISNDRNVSYSACTGAGEGSSYNIRMRKTVTKDGNYYHCANTDGWISPNISSSYSTGIAGTKMETDFDTVASSNTQYVWVRTYHANVNKVRIYADFRANDMTVSNVYKHTAYFSADSKYAVDYTAVYNGDEENENTGTAAQGYVDITLDEVMAANDILLVKFNDSKVRPLGAVITEGSAGSLNTHLQWSGSLENGATVDKYTTDAYFTYSASKITENTNTLGAITYSSSNTSVATVDATGKVALVAAGETTIKATLAASGCYKKAEISYTLKVTEVACAITAGTLTLTSGAESKCSSDNVTLELTGFESGASIQWKDGDTDINNEGNYTIAMDGTTSTLTTNQEGTYSVMVTKDCSVRSNRITISNKSTEVGAKRIVKNWYIKNGRPTPDIELWTLQNGAHLSSVAWDPANNTTGLTASDFYESDGKVYLKGKEPSSNTSGADIDYTLTLTVEDDCGSTTAMSASGQLIYLHHQKNTDKHVLAFVVTGTEKGGFTEGITAAQTTSVELYNTIAANFDVLATNIYSTDDEQALKEYYSQFDILCVTDYPNTGTKGVNKKSYVDALGALVDIRPILTMEAFVAKLANWKAKGISGTPQSPTTRQYTMLLQCKDHEIFSGTELTKVGEGDETMYRVSMVDNTLEDYKTLDATYGSGTHEEKKNYNYGGKPALQGFTFTKEMLDDDLLPLGLIDDGSGNDLQVGIERQTEMEARLMVLGINSYAMERLTPDGQKVVVNALKYLMKKNSEDIADCSNTFVGGDDEEAVSTRYNWDVASHWSGNAVPDRTQKVRIVARCVIPANVKPHVTGVIIAPSGKYNHGANTANGSLTIAAGGALIVDGKVEAATAPYFTKTRATSSGDLAVLADADAQGALIFDNSEGETQATVQMYSPSYWEIMEGTNKKKSYWSYVAIPIQDAYVGEFFYGAVTYLYDETSGWIRKKIGSHFYAFDGIGLSLPEGHTETFYGPLAPTEDRTVTLTKTTSGGNGENLIGNSWTAPIQIANFEASDFGSATQNVMIYSTGRDGTQDDVRENAEYVTATVENDGNVSAGQWVSIPINVPSLDGYDGLKVIPAMQAFQVNTNSETSLTLNYDKLVRDVNIVSDNLTEKQHAPARRFAGAKKSLMSTMRVRVSGVKTRTDVWLLEDDRFSEAFDNGWEATYAECDDRSAQLYAQSEIGNMSFLAKPDIEGTVLGFAPSKDGNQYLFTFHYVGDEEYYLNDLKLTSSTLISNESSYLFTYEAGDTNRFYISRQPLGGPAITTGVDEVREEAKPRKFIYNDKMYILFNGRVFDATGKAVK